MPQQWGCGFGSHTDYTHTNLEVKIVQRVGNHREDEHFVCTDGNCIAATKKCVCKYRENDDNIFKGPPTLQTDSLDKSPIKWHPVCFVIVRHCDIKLNGIKTTIKIVILNVLVHISWAWPELIHAMRNGPCVNIYFKWLQSDVKKNLVCDNKRYCRKSSEHKMFILAGVTYLTGRLKDDFFFSLAVLSVL